MTVDSISIPPTFSVDSLNETLISIYKRPSAALRIPNTLRCRSIISSSSYLQLILSWATQSRDKHVILTVKSEKDIEFLWHSAETLIPILVAKTASIENLSKKSLTPVDLPYFQAKGLDIFAQREGGKPSQQNLFEENEVEPTSLPRKGARIHLLAADAFADYAHPNWFYRGTPERRKMRDPCDFISLVRSVTSLLNNTSPNGFGKWVEPLANPIGEMLFELIDNTHNWGRHGLKQELIPLVRGVLFDLRFDHLGNQTLLADIADDIPMIQKFILFHQNTPRRNPLGLMETTVFDAGTGIPARLLNIRNIKNPSINEELDATVDCFNKWTTSSRTLGRGLGLNKVMEITAKKQGFVYLRTGRLSLFRDFANDPDTQQGSLQREGRFEFKDSTTKSPEPTENPVVAGTFLSVVLPISIPI